MAYAAVAVRAVGALGAALVRDVFNEIRVAAHAVVLDDFQVALGDADVVMLQAAQLVERVEAAAAAAQALNASWALSTRKPGPMQHLAGR